MTVGELVSKLLAIRDMSLTVKLKAPHSGLWDLEIIEQKFDPEATGYIPIVVIDAGPPF